jgi:hypothetical protein
LAVCHSQVPALTDTLTSPLKALLFTGCDALVPVAFTWNPMPGPDGPASHITESDLTFGGTLLTCTGTVNRKSWASAGVAIAPASAVPITIVRMIRIAQSP